MSPLSLEQLAEFIKFYRQPITHFPRAMFRHGPGKQAYTILGLSPGRITMQAAKAAYRKLQAEYHPDKVSHLGKELQELAAIKALQFNLAFRRKSHRSPRHGRWSHHQRGVVTVHGQRRTSERFRQQVSLVRGSSLASAALQRMRPMVPAPPSPRKIGQGSGNLQTRRTGTETRTKRRGQ
jgi:curved DNA-binding protein CbpA